MSSPLIAVSYDFWIVALSYLIASFASYVALDLAKRVRTPDRAMATGWWACGSLAMGTGIWAMHFVGMLALELPFAVGYGHAVTGLSWVAGVGVSAVALYIASFRHLRLLRLIAGALTMGAGICAMHYTGMAAMDMAPGIQWDWRLIVASAAIAVTASAVALLIFFWLRTLTGAAARRWQFAAALIMGAAICGMHYTGMAAAGFAEGSICRSAGQLRGEGLGLLVTVASLVLLTLTMLGAVLDSRLQGRSTRLAASLKTANTELQQLAFRDALTGLPNRLLFDERATSAVERSARSNLGFAVLFVDLDGFKPVNDSFGHALGDVVLREMAQRLHALTRSSDTVARVGGDEFVLLLEEMDGQGAAATAQRIIDACSAPVAGGGHELRLSCSVGIAVFPTDGPLDQLLAHADAAMYAAKRAGGSTYAFFEPKMNAGMREQIELQRDLRTALAIGGQLELHYQPKVHSASGVITGVEALVRWRHPQRGLLAPGLFIPVAERFGLIAGVGDWVIDQACRQLRDWIDEGLQLRMAINLSVVQLRQDELVAKVRQALHEHRLEGSLLTFEITESVAMDDAEGTLRAFEDLAALGVRLSIDDFGTGYSSLAYLRKLRAGQLKIDRSFVQDLDSSADARAIVEAVVRLSHSLGLNVVAEGVETEAQRKVLADLGCDELQGFFFARPMPAHVLAEWAANHGRPQVLHFADSAYVDVGG